MSKLDIYLYNEIFAAEPRGGNGCWVVPLADETTDEHMQFIAAELALPATAFVIGEGSTHTQLRFFSPTREFSMCGHAVVAASCALVDNDILPCDSNGETIINFQTMAGEIPAQVHRNLNGPTECSMFQRKPWFAQTDVSADLVAPLLGLAPDCIDSDLPIETGSTGLKHVFVPILSMQSMYSMTPNFSGLGELSARLDVESVAVFSLDTGTSETTARVRDFCPAIGVNEEPASGTTNGAVGSYLVRHGKAQTDDHGDVTIVSNQGIEMGKPSKLRTQIHVDENNVITKVKVGGTAKPQATGVFDVP